MPKQGSKRYIAEVIRYVPSQRRIIRAGLVLIVIFLIVGAYYLGGANGRAWRQTLEEKNSLQLAQIEELEKKNSDLRRRQSALSLEVELGSRSSEKLRQDLITMDVDRADLEEQIAFYRGLMDPNMSGELSFRNVKIKQGLLPDEYIVSGVVQQLTLNHSLVKGSVNIVITGVKKQIGKSGKQVDAVVDFEGKALSKDTSVPLRFKYFQNFVFNVKFPSQFSAKTLSLKATTTGKDGVSVDVVYDWNELVE